MRALCGAAWTVASGAGSRALHGAGAGPSIGRAVCEIRASRWFVIRPRWYVKLPFFTGAERGGVNWEVNQVAGAQLSVAHSWWHGRGPHMPCLSLRSSFRQLVALTHCHARSPSRVLLGNTGVWPPLPTGNGQTHRAAACTLASCLAHNFTHSTNRATSNRRDGGVD